MLLAHISDLHVLEPGKLAYGVVDTTPLVEKAIAHLNTLGPDLVVITGDLVHNAQIAEYQRLQAMLQPLQMPVYLIPGNHDSRALIREVFSTRAYLPTTGFLQYTVIDLMDGCGLTGIRGLETVVQKYDCIQRIGCGHVHRPMQKLWAGTLAYTVPSPVHQVSLDLTGDAKSATFVMEPPAYQLHLWNEESGLISHTQYINQYDGPYPFFKTEKSAAT